MPPIGTRYRISKDGHLWQGVRPGPRSPIAGHRDLGELVGAGRAEYPGSVKLLYRGEWSGPAPRWLIVHIDNVTDERPGAPLEVFRGPLPTIAGGDGRPRQKAKVLDAHGCIAELELEDGRRFWGVVCPNCGANLMAASLGRKAVRGERTITEIWHPLACHACGAALLEVDSPLLVLPGGPIT